ncbi:MipA/OmpV family protein [Paucibacter sp. R3-3]|uniref:MipA/OmpV family protein n=1 Tax=Roseateles agri TaxID=3098619 RepID=A0ABU5DAM3_9BURK|nr:MipA/OmpV family protein [Paucibacter sp. R3-3]MDY0743184.1 MipA/OmpV family protein [Paucibacter sp. R3-3]
MLNTRRLQAVLSASLLALLLPNVSSAEEPGSDATPWRVGIGVASMARPYAGADNKTVAFPNVSYENDYVRIAGLGADLKLGSTGPFSFALRLKYALGDGYKASDAPILNGMDSRQGSLWLGPSVRWKGDLGRISLDLAADALGKSKGLQLKLGAEHDFRAGSFLLTPHLAAEFVDKKYVDYYYGVTADEATANRTAYTGRSTVNLEAGLRAGFMIDTANSIFADVGVKSLGKGITDSSLVDRKTTPVFLLGYVHRF